MIQSENLRDALSDLIKNKACLKLRVFFNHVANSSEDYCWVRLRPNSKNIGQGYLERRIKVDFQIVLAPLNGIVKHTALLDIIDKLDAAIVEPLQVEDRFITIYDAQAIIFDDILTYSFELNFCDAVDIYRKILNEYETMNELRIKNL